jgi:hypothetical protein
MRSELVAGMEPRREHKSFQGYAIEELRIIATAMIQQRVKPAFPIVDRANYASILSERFRTVSLWDQ